MAKKYPTPIMILEHKETKEIKKLKFEPGFRFMIKLSKMVKHWDLKDVEGNPEDPTVKFMLKQISKTKDSTRFKIERSEIFKTTSEVTGQSVTKIKETVEKKTKSYSAKLLRKVQKWRNK